MEFNLRLREVCPRCNTLVHAVCGCGHAFASKRKAQCTTNESERASESEKETDKVRRAKRRAWLGILYIHDTCFPKNNNTALICHNQCSRRGFALQCFSLPAVRLGWLAPIMLHVWDKHLCLSYFVNMTQHYTDGSDRHC